MSNIVNNLVEDYIRTTLKEKDGLLRELEEYANEHNVPIVHKEVSELLKVLLKIQKPKRILEVGCAIGYSSILFASVLDEDVEIITVERNEKMIEKAKENIKLANPQATDKEIEEVCKEAQLHDVIIEMQDGYDTIVGENGVILSGGQKQRLAIARALIKKSKIILFDEATSSLDNNNQEKIKNIIKSLSKDHTVIIVAHRLSTIIDSDCIFVLDNHGIIDSGTHNELIKKCLEYKNLYEIEEY